MTRAFVCQAAQQDGSGFLDAHYSPVRCAIFTPSRRLLNLRREFPRIPFYENFWEWADDEAEERLAEVQSSPPQPGSRGPALAVDYDQYLCLTVLEFQSPMLALATPSTAEAVLPLRVRYRQEMNGQIVHDSIHRRRDHENHDRDNADAQNPDRFDPDWRYKRGVPTAVMIL
jgi:hypothetical protein